MCGWVVWPRGVGQDLLNLYSCVGLARASLGLARMARANPSEASTGSCYDYPHRRIVQGALHSRDVLFKGVRSQKNVWGRIVIATANPF